MVPWLIPAAMTVVGAGSEFLKKKQQEEQRKKDILRNALTVKYSPWTGLQQKEETQVTADPLRGALVGGASGIQLMQGFGGGGADAATSTASSSAATAPRVTTLDYTGLETGPGFNKMAQNYVSPYSYYKPARF